MFRTNTKAKIMQATYGDQRPHRSNPLAWAVLAIVVLAVIAFFAVLAFHGYPMGMSPYYYGYSGFGWWFFFPFGFLFFLGIIFLVSRLIFWPWGWGGAWRRHYWYGYGDAREILRQRYARGEITKDQYDQMNRDLDQQR
jgi:putative membrane protein